VLARKKKKQPPDGSDNGGVFECTDVYVYGYFNGTKANGGRFIGWDNGQVADTDNKGVQVEMLDKHILNGICTPIAYMSDGLAEIEVGDPSLGEPAFYSWINFNKKSRFYGYKQPMRGGPTPANRSEDTMWEGGTARGDDIKVVTEDTTDPATGIRTVKETTTHVITLTTEEIVKTDYIPLSQQEDNWEMPAGDRRLLSVAPGSTKRNDAENGYFSSFVEFVQGFFAKKRPSRNGRQRHGCKSSRRHRQGSKSASRRLLGDEDDEGPLTVETTVLPDLVDSCGEGGDPDHPMKSELDHPYPMCASREFDWSCEMTDIAAVTARMKELKEMQADDCWTINQYDKKCRGAPIGEQTCQLEGGEIADNEYVVGVKITVNGDRCKACSMNDDLCPNYYDVHSCTYEFIKTTNLALAQEGFYDEDGESREENPDNDPNQAAEFKIVYEINAGPVGASASLLMSVAVATLAWFVSMP